MPVFTEGVVVNAEDWSALCGRFSLHQAVRQNRCQNWNKIKIRPPDHRLFLKLASAILHLIPPPARSLLKMTISPATAAAQAVLSTVDLSSYDAVQSKLMEERCILVDENDKAIGAMDKKTCEQSDPVHFITC